MKIGQIEFDHSLVPNIKTHQSFAYLDHVCSLSDCLNSVSVSVRPLPIH